MRFGPPIRSNALGELKDLRRTGSVEDYQRQFLALLCRCDNLTWQHQVDLFTSGLGQPLCSDVEMQRPASLQTAMSLARAFEKRAAEAARAVSSTAPRSGTRQRPPAPSQPATAPPAEKQDEQRPRFRRLSPEEIAEKRANGQCYFCPKKFTKEHRCARKDVFLMELEDGEELSDDADTVSISLHALTGITAADTLKLRVRVAGADLVALVDTGSTHTFISTDIASKLGLHATPRPGLSVKVANGERVASGGLCASTDVLIANEQFAIDCYMLPLADFDMVLGVRWLRTLGPIIWNFALSPCFSGATAAPSSGQGSAEPRRQLSPSPPAWNCFPSCWTPTPTSSPSPMACHHCADRTTAYTYCRQQHRWLCGHIGTPSC